MIATFKKSKRWLTLAIFSLVLAVLAIVSLSKTNPVSEIEKLGGKITRSRDRTAAEVWLSKKDWRWASSWVSRISRRFSSVVTVDLRNTQITDTGLAHLKDLTQLLALSLTGTQITDAGLAHLKDLAQLRELHLGNTKVTDAGLVHLKIFPKLSHLDLGNATVTDTGLAHLEDLTQLVYLDLNGTQVTDEGREELLRAILGLTIPSQPPFSER